MITCEEDLVCEYVEMFVCVGDPARMLPRIRTGFEEGEKMHAELSKDPLTDP